MASVATGLSYVTIVLLAQTILVACTPRLFDMKMWDDVSDFLDNFETNLVESDCKRDLLLVAQKSQTEEWALRMWDAWAKPQTGILTGNSMHLGNFDECLAIDWVDHNGSAINGQYCTAFINPRNDQMVEFLMNTIHGMPTNPSGLKSGLVRILDKFRLSWGICVPSTCTTDNLWDVWNFTKNYYNVSWDVEFNSQFCDYRGKYELSDFAYFTIFFLCLCLSVVVTGTLYHIFFHKDHKKFQGMGDNKPSFLMEFSAYANSKKILDGKSSDPLACLNAVRVLSLFWIIVRHYFMLIYYFPHLNGMDLAAWKAEYGSMFILSGSMAVDSFFAASGLSVAYLFMKSRETEVTFSLFTYYVHKLIKVMPTLVLVVLIYASLLTYLGNGPFWPIIYNLFQRDCENNWWSTILFVANYVHPTNHCLTQGWYLSVDLQLFFLSPLLLLPLTRWPKPTIVATVMIILASMVQCFIESWTMNLGSTHFDENANFHANIVATHIRAPVWLIGFIVGYILYKFKDTPIRLKKVTVCILWSASLCIFLIIILGHQTVAGNEYNIVRSSLFNTLVRPAWAVVLCWVIFACMKGYGGFANKILTAPIFNMIIKINFNMFLLHVLPQIYFIGQTRMSTYFNHSQNLYLVLADLAGALLFSFVWTLIFEPWVAVMERALFSMTSHEQKVCTISLLPKDNSEKRNDINYVTVSTNGKEDRESP